MTRRRLAIIFFFIGLAVVIGFGTWWIISATAGSHGLEAGRHYQMRFIHFRVFLDENGNRIRLEDNDTSYLVFNSNFTQADVNFMCGATYTFAITSSNTSRRTFNAELVGIVGGHLIRFNITTSDSYILIRSSIDYNARIESADEYGFFDIEFSRNDPVLRFRR